MFLTMVFLALWQGTNSPQYYEPTRKCAEAAYANSELKHNADNIVEYAKNKMPGVAAIAPALYVVAVRRTLQYTTPKYTPIPGTIASYHYEGNTATFSVVWHF